MPSEPTVSSPPPVTGAADAMAQRIAVASRKLNVLSSDVSRLVDQIDRWNGRSSAAAPAEAPAAPADEDAAIEQLAGQVAALAGGVRQLESRLRGLEDLSLAAPRKPISIRLIELLIGREYYRPWRRKGAVPAVTVVVPAGDDDATALTVRSVLQGGNAGWDVLVAGPDPGPRLQQELSSGMARARHVLATGPMWERVDKGLGEASRSGVSTVIAIVHPGQHLEPTAAAAVMRFFSDHPRSMAAYFERTVRRGAWRQPMLRPRRMDVYGLLAEPGTNGWGHGGVFFRRRALGMVGGFKPAMRSAAQWHLYLRLARMFGLGRGSGQVLCITAEESAPERIGEYLEFEQARQEFLGNFGLAGRVRCRVIEALHRLLDATEDRPEAPPLPGDISGPDIEPQPVECPLSGKRAERLLFTAGDAAGRPCYVYECPDGLGAVVRATAPSDAAPIPLGEEPELMRMTLVLMRGLKPNDQDLRVLVVGEWAADIMSQQVGLKLTRIDPGSPLEKVAVTLPEDQRFDVVWIGSAIAGSPDPAAVLRSLRSVLASRAIVAIAGPNFDAPSRKRLGPAWTGWDFSRRPLVLGRRGVREMARLSDLRVRWLSTRGDTWLALLVAE